MMRTRTYRPQMRATRNFILYYLGVSKPNIEILEDIYLTNYKDPVILKMKWNTVKNAPSYKWFGYMCWEFGPQRVNLVSMDLGFIEACQREDDEK
jgi:hypothetical protein